MELHSQSFDWIRGFSPQAAPAAFIRLEMEDAVSGCVGGEVKDGVGRETRFSFIPSLCLRAMRCTFDLV